MLLGELEGHCKLLNLRGHSKDLVMISLQVNEVCYDVPLDHIFVDDTIRGQVQLTNWPRTVLAQERGNESNEQLDLFG